MAETWAIEREDCLFPSDQAYHRLDSKQTDFTSSARLQTGIALAPMSAQVEKNDIFALKTIFQNSSVTANNSKKS
jgi:hypothetical protein